MKKSNEAEIKYDVVFEDENIVVINKPCGVAVQAEGHDIVKHMTEKYKTTVSPITRIDQPVSGIVLLAKTHKMAAYLSKLIRNKQISKSYLAVVEGQILQDEITLEHQLIKKGNKAIVVDEHGEDARLTILKVKNLDNYTLIKITTETGKFHQIRAQLASIGHPVKGDLKYGSKRSNAEGGIYLHCHEIRFKYFDRGKSLQCEAIPPGDKKLYVV